MDDLATKVFEYKFPSHTKGRKMTRFPFLTTDPLQFMADYTFTYQDGIKWHDIACYHTKPFICEDSEQLLEYARLTNPELNIF